MRTLPGSEALRDILTRAQGRAVLVVGDCMLDHYLLGEVGRISPEAPVPVVRVLSERQTAGGAGNVARNLAALGAKPFLLSAVGDDAAGSLLASILESGNVEAVLAREADRPTTIKTRIIAQNQQVVRVDRESAAPLGEGARRLLAEALGRLVPKMDAVVVSDYAKGVIGPEIMRALFAARDGREKHPLILVDPKPANRAFYAGADLLTPNLKEAGEMTGIHGSERLDILKAGVSLFRQCRCQSLCITMGAAGIALFRSPGDVVRLPTAARRVYDVTGAGDSVMAALACSLAAKGDVLAACMLANACAGIAVSQVGAAAVTREELLEALSQGWTGPVETWLDDHGAASVSDAATAAKP